MQAEGGVFLHGAGDAARPLRSQRVLGAREPREMELREVERGDARRCRSARSLAGVPISVWVCQIQIYSPQRLLLLLTKSCRKEENEPNSVVGFFVLLFVSLAAVRSGAVAVDDVMSL